MHQAKQLDRYLPAPIRVWIEQTYYAQINAQAQLEVALADPTFYCDPAAHLALFNDHGVVHVRDVAQQVLRLLDLTHGTLIARRERERLQGFMKSYGVLVAYLHDIGMIDFRPLGRAMHPEFASQALFEPAFDYLVDAIWHSDCGGIAARLRGLASAGVLALDPRLVLRELLAMANCHSKSKVPAAMRWSHAERQAAAARLARGGHNMAAVEPDSAFDQVQLIRLQAGETLLEAGTTARFVYIPLGEGLMVVPLGGYPPFAAPAWLPVGSTGVIRGAQRNASIYATCDLTLLIIPQAVYLNAWHRPYQPAELVARLESDSQQLS